MADPAEQLEPLEELTGAFTSLAPNGQRLLLALARRLVLGQQRYGDFPTRDWTREAREEALDLAVYLAAELIEGR